MDQSPTKFLKEATDVSASPLVKMIHLLIKRFVFSEEHKIAELKPQLNKGPETDSKNYRPISLLPVKSQIIEKSIYYQLKDNTEKNGLLYKYQPGFRDKGMQTDMILIDLQ